MASIPGPHDIVCPDPSAHEHLHSGKKSSEAASKAALLVTQSARDSSAANPDGRSSANLSAQHNLTYAKAQDLPSFPSRGASTGAALAAASLAKDYQMKELWQPEMSAAGSKAALLAHRDGGNVDLWQPTASAAGNSAAAMAMRNKDLSPEVDRGYTDTGRSSSLMAAAKSHTAGRQRAGSTPVAPPPNYPDSHNSSKNALSAATVSHRTSTRMAPDGWNSDAMQAARLKNVGSRMSRELFTEHPPVEPELEEQRHQAALRASAVSMAKSMYEMQNRAATPSDASSMIGSAGAGAEVAHRRNRSLNSQAELKEEALRYINVQEAAQKMAQERLAKMEKELEAGRFKEYYGYGDKSPRKSRMSIRRRGRSSSEPQTLDDSDDEQQARRIRSQMSQLSTAQNTISDRQRQEDRARLMAAAEKRVQARMHDLDEKVYLETGKVSQAMMDGWETEAREKAERDKEQRDRDAPPGKTHIGGGKYMDKADIEAIAAARLKGTLDEINENAERMRARDAEVARQKDEAETARMEEKMKARQRDEEAANLRAEDKQKERDQKAEFKRLKEQDKANARKEKADREAAARREREERDAAARRGKEERKAKEKADKEEAKARKAEDKRISRDQWRSELYTLAGGAAVGGAAGAAAAGGTAERVVKPSQDLGERRLDESRETGTDASTDVEQKVKIDKERDDDAKPQASVVAGGVALGEVADKVKEDNIREAQRQQDARMAGAENLAKVATNLKEEQEKEQRRDEAARIAGSDALATVATNVKKDQEKEQQRDEEARIAGSAALAKVATNLKEEQEKEDKRKDREAERDRAATVAGGAALGEIAEKVKRDRDAEEQRRSVETRDSEDDLYISRTEEMAGAGAAAAVLGAGGIAATEHANKGDAGRPSVETGNRASIDSTNRAKYNANIFSSKIKEPVEEPKDESLAFEPHRSDITDIKDPRPESARPTTAGTDRTAEEAAAAIGAGAITGGAVAEAESKDKGKESAKLTKEPPKEKKGMFKRLTSRLSSRADEDKRQVFPSRPTTATSEKKADAANEEPGAEAADGAVAAGIPVAGLALAAAGGTDEARGEVEEDSVRPQHAPEPHDDEDDADVDRSRAAEALIGVGVGGTAAAAGVASGVAFQHHSRTGPREEEEERSDVSSLHSEDDGTNLGHRATHSGDYNFATSDNIRPNRPDIERHISTLDYSSDDGARENAEDDDDDDDDFDFEDGAGYSRITADSPVDEEERVGRYRGFASTTVPTSQHAAPVAETHSPVSPLREEEASVEASTKEAPVAIFPAMTPGPAPVVAADHEPAAPAPAVAPRASQDEKATTSQPDKSKKGIKGLFSKLTSKSDNKLTKRSKGGDAESVKSATSVVSAEHVSADVPESSKDKADAGIVTPVTTTSAGLAEKQGPPSSGIAVAGTQREPPGSPSSFTRHGGPPAARDLDEVSSSGAEEEDVKRGRAGRLAKKLGLSRDRDAPPKTATAAAATAPKKPTTTTIGAPAGESNGDEDEEQFEEAQDHFDESLVAPPAFAGQARHEGSSPVRGTRFQEEF